MARASSKWLAQLPRRAGNHTVPALFRPETETTVAEDLAAPVAEGQEHLGEHRSTRGTLLAQGADPASVSDPTVCREISEVEAECVGAHARIRAGGTRQSVSLPQSMTGADSIIAAC